MSGPQPRTAFANLMDALSVQTAVIGALIIRELHTRFGRDNIGYLWMIVEPLMLASVISTLHVFMGGHPGAGDINPGAFTLIGYTIFIIFRGIFNKAESALDAGLPLLYHRTITLFDIMLSRSLLEALSVISAMVILMTIFINVGLASLPFRPLYLFAAIGLITWFSFAASLIVAGSVVENNTAARLVHPISYFMIPLSGAFWMLDWVPQPYRDWISWNPMVLIFEAARYGQFQDASPAYIDFEYVIAWNVCLTYIGLIAIRKVKSRIHLS